MQSISGLRRLAVAFFLACLCLIAHVVAADSDMSVDKVLDQVAKGMVRRHSGLQLAKVDPNLNQLTVKRGEGDKAQTLYLFVNEDESKLANEDYFEHFEYKGFEFRLTGNNNMAVVGAVDGFMDQLEAVTQYLKAHKIEPENLKAKSRISILFAGELVFKFELADADQPAQYLVNGMAFQFKKLDWFADTAVAANCKAFHDASIALQKKIEADDNLSFGVKKALIHFVEISHETDAVKLNAAKHDDQLTDAFCRLVLNDQYLERALGKLADNYKSELADWRKACAMVSAYKPRFVLQAEDKSELTEYQNSWSNKLWVYYRGASGETHLIIRHHEPDQFKLYMHRIFAKADPKDFDKLLSRDDCDRVALSFPFYGTLASYDLKTKQFQCDMPIWNNAAKAFFPSKMNSIFLPPEQMCPPHIPVYRYDGMVQGLIVPKGAIMPPDFSSIPANKRQAAHDAFLQELADKLDTPGNLHLLFETLSQYVFDTPDPRFPQVIGNATQKSDIHQTTDQTLDSHLGGRFLGDCDDMAEFYTKVTQLQGKQSFVMGVPGHATCGYVTKLAGDKDKKEPDRYQLNFLDTGPARELVRGDLDKLIEEGVRSYDQENRMTFSPDAVEFLFRFAGESTRTPYVLSTRMFIDSKYAEAMIRVQSYWHYHTYNLGIQTMEKMLADGDRDSANYNEVASLYSQSRLWENCLSRHAEDMKAVKKDDMLTMIESKIRLSDYQHDAQMYDEAAITLTDLNKTLAEVPQQDLQRVLEFIVQAGNMWVQIKQPFHAYEPMHRIMVLTRGNLFPPLAPGVVSIYEAMTEYNTTHELTKEETASFREVEAILSRFYGHNETMFANAEDTDDELMRYASLAAFYRARMGEKAFREKLLAGDKAPAKGEKPSGHRDPADPDSDFLYFRSCYFVFLNEVGKCLDDDEGRKTPDVKEALKWSDLAMKAFDRQQEFTESTTGDLSVKELQANVALLTKDWPGLTKLYDDACKQDYARHTMGLTQSLGAMSKFLTLDEFKKACDLWDTHIKSKQYYYLIAYSALQAKSYDACGYAADVAAKRFPAEPTMVDEARALHKSIPLVKKWYEDRAVVIKKAADEAKKKAEEDKKKAADEENKKAAEDRKKNDKDDAPKMAPKPPENAPAPTN